MADHGEAGIDLDMDVELAAVQGQAAGLKPEIVPLDGQPDTRSVEFMGRRFRIADKIGLMPLLKFSAAADFDVNDPRALAAMYAMLRDCVYPGTPACGDCPECEKGDERACPEYTRSEWPAFEEHAMMTRADADELLDVITKVVEMIAGRPTKPPQPSSNGQRGISAGSMATGSGTRKKGSRR